jgi:hypothetical protein
MWETIHHRLRSRPTLIPNWHRSKAPSCNGVGHTCNAEQLLGMRVTWGSPTCEQWDIGWGLEASNQPYNQAPDSLQKYDYWLIVHGIANRGMGRLMPKKSPDATITAT